MRFLVLGAGSLGSYFGGMLLQGGADLAAMRRALWATRGRRNLA
jgi:ketopantoate reductase